MTQKPFDEIKILLNAADSDAENTSKFSDNKTVSSAAASLGLSRISRAMRLLVDHLENGE